MLQLVDVGRKSLNSTAAGPPMRSTIPWASRRSPSVSMSWNLSVELPQLMEGQVRGLQKMIEEDRYCVDVLTQIAAVQEALTQVSKIMMRNYLESCATDAIRSDDPTEAYDELMEVIFRYRR